MNKSCKCLSPSINNTSEILILGSMPGVTSIEKQQYYAQPHNRFWKIMGIMCEVSNLYELNYESKLNVLLSNNIALWDTLDYCERSGSLDSKIKNERPNDIRKLLKDYPNIKIICLNGQTSYSTLKKYFPDLLSKYTCYLMPSTSRANAKYSLDNLVKEWSKFKQ